MKPSKRLDILEQAWEIFVDQLAELHARIENLDTINTQCHNLIYDDVASTKRDIDILLDALLELERRPNPQAEAVNEELLDGLDDFETAHDCEEFVKRELAKGDRANTIQAWLEEHAQKAEEEADNE